jgi:tetratricopeptide (TPR) repeat protein
MPGEKILYRETYAADGTVKVLDAKGKELACRKCILKAAREPSLKANTAKLVVLSLPFRSSEHILKTLKIQGKNYAQLRFADALPLLAAHVGADNGNEAQTVFRQAFYDRDQRQLGFYVLLAACGQNLDAANLDVMAEHPDEPLAQYLALYSSPVLRAHASQWAVASRQWDSPFLRHLAQTHALYQRWQSDKVTKGSPAKVKAQREQALAYVRRHKGTVFGWAMLSLMQDRAGTDKAFHQAIAETWPLFANMTGLTYAVRYEEARCWWKAGKKDEARKRFRKLYEQTLREGYLPRIDAVFREALRSAKKEAEGWSGLLNKTAGRLIAQKRRPAVLALAWQCWQLGDKPLANHLLAVALHGIRKDRERLPMTLAALDFLQETGQFVQAERMLQKLLDKPKWAKRAGLWRLGVQLAESRDHKGRALECLEQALEAEYRNLPAVLDLKSIQKDYGKLLEHYQNLADAMVTLKMKPPAGFVAKVVRAADRWRALDRSATQPCQLAARVLKTLGEQDLSWDYLTTPIALRPNEAEPLVELAQTLTKQGDLALADRAYASAFEAEPTNAQILWDRADNLRQAGHTVAARKLFRQLAEGKWQPRFEALKEQARWQLKGGD